MSAAPLIHLDTDLGGDPDDVCALAMLLGCGVELTGITTTIDPRGQRAGYARHVLRLAGRADVPVAAGSEETLTSGDVVEPLSQLWPPDVTPLPGAIEAAHDLLSASIQRSATVVAVGPLSTLATLEQRRPGTLAGARVVVMGGWTEPLPADLPAYGPADDWNVAVDPDAAVVVATSGADLTWVPLAVTLRASLRTVDLTRLRAAGRLGTVLAEQSVTYAGLLGKAELGRAHPGLPDDLLLSLHDPLACAVALRWAGVPVNRRRLRPIRVEGGMVLRPVEPNGGGVDMGVAESVDGPGFAEAFLAAVEEAGGRSQEPPG